MSTVAEVRLWGSSIGAVSVNGPGEIATFEYTAAFRRSGIEIAPRCDDVVDVAQTPDVLRELFEVWRFRFNYRPDYRGETAFLLQNGEGVFILVGTPCPAPFLEPAASAPPADDGEDEGDLDFEML